MKKFLIMLVALVAVLAFVSGAFAAEKKAAAPKASGTVVACEAGDRPLRLSRALAICIL